jgi:hypothetical protein
MTGRRSSPVETVRDLGARLANRDGGKSDSLAIEY